MELTPDEKQKIYAEEKERLEARSQLEKEEKAKQAQVASNGCAVVGIAFTLLCFGLIAAFNIADGTSFGAGLGRLGHWLLWSGLLAWALGYVSDVRRDYPKVWPNGRKSAAVGCGLFLISTLATPTPSAPDATGHAGSTIMPNGHDVTQSDISRQLTLALDADGNPKGIDVSAMSFMDNPNGAGTFVYNRSANFGQTDSSGGISRPVAWIAIEGKLLTLNGAAKAATPSLQWPRDVSPSLWQKAGLNTYSPMPDSLRQNLGL